MFEHAPVDSSALVGTYLTDESPRAGSLESYPKSGNLRYVPVSDYQKHLALLFADQERARSELSQLKDLETGWDGDGAERINSGAIVAAHAALEKLLPIAPAPAIVPNVNGTASLEWDTELGYAHLELSSKAYSFLLAAKGKKAIGMKGQGPAPYAHIANMICSALFDTQSGYTATTVIVYST